MNSGRLAGKTVLITAAAQGIGRASALACAREGAEVIATDIHAGFLDSLRQEHPSIRTALLDVRNTEAVNALAAELPALDALFNCAGMVANGSVLDCAEADWDLSFDLNVKSMFRMTRAFLPGMLERGREGLIICTGSKQGITTPPGNPAYNVSKAGVKVFTEALQHDLRGREGCKISAHLLIPGFVFTGLTVGVAEKPAAAWTAEQTVDFMLESIGRGDFYILCPDNEVTRDLDAKRILWAAGDIAANRPPLSRWHHDYAEAFKASLGK